MKKTQTTARKKAAPRGVTIGSNPRNDELLRNPPTCKEICAHIRKVVEQCGGFDELELPERFKIRAEYERKMAAEDRRRARKNGAHKSK